MNADARHARHWVDGQWLDEGSRGESRDPASNDLIGSYVKAGREQALRAVEAARTVFLNTMWRDEPALRSSVLIAMADRFEERTDELVDLLSLENGKIKPEARFEVSMWAPTLRFNAALALGDVGRASRPASGALSIVTRQPAGVAGVIAPWNSPVALLLRLLAPALAAGCTTVVSLPVATAQTNALLADIIGGTPGLPDGVVNVLIGGRDAAGALVTSPDVPVLSFTGSTKTGRAITGDAALYLKRIGLELGGKAPMVVFDDADLDRASEDVCRALTTFTGQFCMTGSRLLVHAGVADDVIARVAERLRTLRVGPSADPASEMGPLIDQANVDRVDRFVDDAIDAGARAIVRGGPFSEGPLSGGAFYAPTLLEVTDNAATVVQEEIFAPVLTVQRFEAETEAVDLANSTEYGLSASIYTRDVDRALRVASLIDAGTVWVNDWATLWNQSEEGGFKASGVGRMRGFAVMDDFIEQKHIALHWPTDPKSPREA